MTTKRRQITLASIHAREDEGLRKAMQAGIQARRDGVAREACPFTGHSWKRNWVAGYDYEANKVVKQHPEIGRPTT